MTRFFLITLIMLFQIAFSTHAIASDGSDILDEIAKFADRNCDIVAKSGGNISADAKARIHAELAALFKRFADPSGEVDLEGRINLYSGVAQKDLAGVLNNVLACKKQVIHDLVGPLGVKKVVVPSVADCPAGYSRIVSSSFSGGIAGMVLPEGARICIIDTNIDSTGTGIYFYKTH